MKPCNFISRALLRRHLYRAFRAVTTASLTLSLTGLAQQNLQWTTAGTGIFDGGGSWNQGTASAPQGWYNGSSYTNVMESGDNVYFGGGTSGAAGVITNASGGVNPGNLSITNAFGGGMYSFTNGPINMNGGTISNLASQQILFAVAVNGSFTVAKTKSGESVVLHVYGNQTGANTITNYGTLIFGNNTSAGNVGTAAIENFGTLNYSYSSNRGASNAISGTGNLVLGPKATTTTTLYGSLSHSGLTTFNNGPSATSGTAIVAMGGAGLLSPVSDFCITNNLYPAFVTTNVLDLAGFNQTINSLTILAPANGPANGMVTNSSQTMATLTLGGADKSTTCNGLLAGPLNLILNGLGSTMVLGAANTYTGVTIVSNGTLLVMGSTGPASVLTVEAGGELGGTGMIGGNATVASGGILAPGVNAIGTLTFNGNLNLAGTTLIQAMANQNGSNDSVVVGGTASYGGTLAVTNAGLTAFSNGAVLQVFQAGSYSGNFSNVTVLGDAITNGSFNPATGQVTLGMTPPPGPVQTTTLLASSMNPSTDGMSVTFSAILQTNAPAGNALGADNNYVFYVDNLPVATNGVSGSEATYTTGNLAPGNHSIEAVYLGDPNYLPSTNSLTQTVTNPPPVANPVYVSTYWNLPLTISPLANDSDPLGRPLSLVSVSASGGTAVITNNSTNVFYTPVIGVSGETTIVYVITNGNGGSATSTITVTNLAPDTVGSTYYVDNLQGNDTNSGLGPTLAWQSLAKVSATTFHPGDQILFKAGGSWVGQVDFNGSGNSNNPIVVDEYGTGSLPLINGNGYSSAVQLISVSCWELNHLEIINDSGTTLSGSPTNRYGIFVQNTSSSVQSNIWFNYLNVNDIFPQSGPNGYGIAVKGDYNGISVENCQFSLTAYYGLWITAPYLSEPDQNILICNNTFTNTGGSGLQTSTCDGVLVQGNVVNGSGASVDPRQWARGSGYWPFMCNNVLVQSNQFMHARGPEDSCGCHIDYGNSNVTIQYNLSLDNEGGFVEILGGGYNLTYRYNVSINDGSRVKGVDGATEVGNLIQVSNYYGGSTNIASTNCMIYNNSIYVDPDITNYITVVPGSVNVFIDNNIFYLAGASVYAGDSSTTFFNNNLWYGNLPAGLPFGSADVFANPLEAEPGGTNDVDYLISPVSPAIAAGLEITNNGGQDYWGNPLPSGPPCIGAVQQSFSDAGVVSVNFTYSSNTNQEIASGQSYGLPSQNSWVAGWTNLDQDFSAQYLPLADGFPSSVTMTGLAPAGWDVDNLAYVNTPLYAGLVDYTATSPPASITLSNLCASFPNGYRVIAYVCGFVANTGASISDGPTTYYYQPLNDPSNQFSGTLAQTTATNDLGNGNNPYAQYAVFGQPVALTNNSLTLTLRALYSGGAILGGFQILATGPLTPHGVPYGWFQEYNLPVDDLADSDLNGIPNWEKYYAGTNPTNPASSFKVIAVQQSGDNLALTWVGGTNGYQGNWSMCVSSNLENWTFLASNSIPRSPNGTNTWVDTNEIQSQKWLFYRPCVETNQ